MDELIQLVSQKVGISEENARQAVETVIEFLEKKLPEPIAGQLESFIEGGGLGQAGDVAEGLSGLLGGFGGEK